MQKVSLIPSGITPPMYFYELSRIYVLLGVKLSGLKLRWWRMTNIRYDKDCFLLFSTSQISYSTYWEYASSIIQLYLNYFQASWLNVVSRERRGGNSIWSAPPLHLTAHDVGMRDWIREPVTEKIGISDCVFGILDCVFGIWDGDVVFWIVYSVF